MQTEINQVLEKIYGSAPLNGRWSPEDLDAGRKLVRVHNVTPARAAWLMAKIADHSFWSGIIQGAKQLAYHYERCAAQIDAENTKRKVTDPDRPYDNPDFRPQPEGRYLRPEEMFRDKPMHSEAAAHREALLARIKDAERRGFRGKQLFVDVLGKDGKGMLGRFGELPAAAQVVTPIPDEAEPLPEVFDLAATRAELAATIEGAPDPANLGDLVAHFPKLISWCDSNPEAGLSEYRRASVDIQTLMAAGVAV